MTRPNRGSLYPGNPATMKMTPEDTKRYEEERAKDMGLILLNEYNDEFTYTIDDSTKQQNVKLYYHFNITSRLLFQLKQQFYGQDLQTYNSIFENLAEQSLFLNNASNYITLRRYLFYFQLKQKEMVNWDNDQFNKIYAIEIDALNPDDGKRIPHFRFSYYFFANRIYFNVFYNNLMISLDLFILLNIKMYVSIKLYLRSEYNYSVVSDDSEELCAAEISETDKKEECTTENHST